MLLFSEQVSDEEYMKAGNPTSDELAVLAHIWGTMWYFGGPLLWGVRVSLELTANARLRYVVAQLLRQLEGGGGPLPRLLSVHDEFSDEFKECCTGSGEVAQMEPRLRQLAWKKGFNPNGVLMDIIDRPIATAELTDRLISVFSSFPDSTLLQALCQIKRSLLKINVRLEVGEMVDALILRLPEVDYPSTAFCEMSDYFDPFYC